MYTKIMISIILWIWLCLYCLQWCREYFVDWSGYGKKKGPGLPICLKGQCQEILSYNFLAKLTHLGSRIGMLTHIYTMASEIFVLKVERFEYLLSLCNHHFYKNVVNFGGKTLKNNLLKFYSALSLTPQDSEDDSMSMASRNLTLRC